MVTASKQARRPARKRPTKATRTRAAGAAKEPRGKSAAHGPSAGRPKAAQRRAAEPPTAKAVREPERSAPPLAEVDADVLEFIAAIDDFKQRHGRPFPSWSEVLLVLRQLGYRRDRAPAR